MSRKKTQRKLGTLMPWMKDILSFYDEKSHAISHKKLGTMMPRMTHLQYHDEVNDTWWCIVGHTVLAAAIRLLRSIFIWAPPRTRPYLQHLCERSKIFQPVSRLLTDIHNAVVAVLANVTSLGCHCLPNMFYASSCFLIYFIWWW